MIYLNLQTQLFRSPECIGSDPVARATWLWVLAYCCEQENGGRIVAARSWKDRQWQQTCGVTLAEIEASTPLLTWDGDDLLVWAYPADKEDEIKRNREIGRRGGSARTEAKARASRVNGGAKPEPAQLIAPPIAPPPETKPKPPAKPKPQRKPALTDEGFIAQLKANPGYAGVDIDRELGKMQAWLLTPRGKGRQITRGFVVNWLNKCDASMATASAQPNFDNGF